MTADQRPTYTPKPVTQRDGSALANSNCRMASIATGLDYETRGGKTSTGAKMRTYTSDQSGGTDSADAAQAWANGYDESLSIRDGYTFENALQDLRGGRLVHLDVWHAATGGPCLSGSGAYGHTIAVLPDCSGGSWLVADPWCNPPKWSRVAESKLRAGAEEWGRRVFGAAVAEADWDTNGDPPATVSNAASKRASIARRVARDMMTRYHAGGPEDPTPAPPETGGAQAILYTRTVAVPLDTGDTEMGMRILLVEDWAGTVTVNVDGASAVQIADSDMVPLARGTAKQAYARAELREPWSTPGGTTFPAGTPGYLVGGEAAFVFANNVDAVPAVADCDQAIADRDQEWASWVLDGSPWGT